MLRVGVDIGGTFTDAIGIDEAGAVFVGKSLTTHDNVADGVISSLADLAEKHDDSRTLRDLLANTDYLGHGTTVGTNALVTRRGSRVGLLITAGFEHTPFIQRSIGRLAGLTERELRRQVSLRQPRPLVDRRCVRGVLERVDSTGKVILPLTEAEAEAAVRDLLDQDVDALAICLLWSFLNPEHERRLAEAARRLAPEVPVSISADLSPKIRENARCNTVVIDAFVRGRVHEYLQRLETQLAESGFLKRVFTMQCFGGVAAKMPSAVTTINSGPVGGVMASKYLAELLGEPDVITTDVGGTTFDVSAISKGQEIIAREFFGAAGVMSRFEVAVPRVDIQSTGAGGGTIARYDPITRSMKLGPDSAGSDPGPAFLRRGGTEPTVADAWMVLGYLDPALFLGGRIAVDVEASRTAIGRNLADPMALSVEHAAAGILDLANNHMSDAIRMFMTARGLDTRNFSLFAFGGGGPMHAAAYGSLAGVKRIYMLSNSSVASAMGIALADVKQKADRSLHMQEPYDTAALHELLTAASRELLANFSEIESKDSAPVTTFFLDMRYVGQVNELTVPLPDADWLTMNDGSAISALFQERYAQAYGDDARVHQARTEIVGIGVEVVSRSAKPSVLIPEANGMAATASRTRRAWFRERGGWVDTPVYDYGSLRSGQVLSGPCFVQSDYSTMLVLTGQSGGVDRFGNVVIDLS